MGSKEAELVTAVLLYAVRCLAEGDWAALRSMRFGSCEIEVLRTLSLEDIYRAGSLRAHCLDIRLDPDLFRKMVQHLAAIREDEDMQRDLMQADAPFEMMRRLFGMGSREYARLRSAMALAPAVGRPPELDEQTSRRLWRALSGRLGSNTDQPLEAHEYLAVQAESDAPLRAIWSHVQRWAEQGDFFGPEGRQGEPSG